MPSRTNELNPTTGSPSHLQAAEVIPQSPLFRYPATAFARVHPFDFARLLLHAACGAALASRAREPEQLRGLGRRRDAPADLVRERDDLLHEFRIAAIARARGVLEPDAHVAAAFECPARHAASDYVAREYGHEPRQGARAVVEHREIGLETREQRWHAERERARPRGQILAASEVEARVGARGQPARALVGERGLQEAGLEDRQVW